MGKQEIEVDGLDPHTRAARTLVEADYRMKLVAMGLEKGVPGVPSYLSQMKPPGSGVLRWWFTLDYDAVLCSRDRLAFEIRGQGVKVESENEHLTAKGERIHTGDAEPLTRKFAENFTSISTPCAGNIRSTPSCGISATWPWLGPCSAKRGCRSGSAGT